MGNFTTKIQLTNHLTQPMNVSFFESILASLDGKMVRPTLYGWYHLLCLALVVFFSVLIILKGKNMRTKTFNIILRSTACALLLFEVYKQLNYSYNPSNDTWGYQWYAFPFQFCSTPMYVMLAASFLKEGKIKSSLCAFLGTYGLFAGSAVMFYPGDVFVKTIGINIQTMVHHGMMVVMGVMMYVSGKVKFSHGTILKALPTFASLVGLALLFNVLFHLYGPTEQTFNMFFISPYYPCTLPILSMIYPLVPYIVFLLLYLIGFTIAGYVMLLIAIAVSIRARKPAAMRTKKRMKNY